MRDLQADLDRCHEYEKEIKLGMHRSNYDIAFAKESREGWPHAIERAIKAEAERCIGETECYFNLKNQIEQLQAELTNYKQALDLACMSLSSQIDKEYCPADKVDFNLDINYCDNCPGKHESICWQDYYLKCAKKEGQ